MKKQLILFLTVFLFCFMMVELVIVSAQPPFQEGDFETGYSIEFHKIDTIKQFSDHTFHFHVYNITDGYPILNSSHGGVVCYFHLYNTIGDHIYVSEDLTDNEEIFDWEISLNGDNFSNTGEYSFVFQCNSSTYGGFVSNPIVVTPTGEPFISDFAFYVISLTIILIGLVVFFTIIFYKQDELWIKVGCFYTIYGLFIVINYMGFIIFSNYLWRASFIGLFFKWLMIIQLFGITPIVMGGLILAGYWAIWNPQMERMQKHGVPEDRAMAKYFRNKGRKNIWG